MRYFRLNGSMEVPLNPIRLLARFVVREKLADKPPDLPRRTGIEFIAQGDKPIPLLTVDANNQLAVFFVFLFSFVSHTVI